MSSPLVNETQKAKNTTEHTERSQAGNF